MTDQQKNFKVCMDAGLRTFRVTPSEFHELRKYNDFLLDESMEPSQPMDLAAKALSELCTGDGQAMDRAVCVGVIQFLGRARGKNPGSDQMRQLIDSLQVVTQLRHVGDKERFKECRKWVESWYG